MSRARVDSIIGGFDCIFDRIMKRMLIRVICHGCNSTLWLSAEFYVRARVLQNPTGDR